MKTAPVRLLLGLAAVAPQARAQVTTAIQYFDAREEGRRALGRSEAARAYGLLRAALQYSPRDGAVWLDLARAARGSNRPDAALEAYREAFAQGAGSRPQLCLDLARLFAEKDLRDSALTWIERALATGWTDRPGLQQDSAFARLKNHPRFRTLTGLHQTAGLSREAGWRHDLEYLLEEARRLHASPTRPAHSASFEQAVRRLEARVRQLSDAKVAVEIQRLLALLGDGHSILYPFPTPRVAFDLLPVDLWRFADGVFVIGGDGDAAQLVGARVTHIGGRPVEEVRRDLAPYVSRDNPQADEYLGIFFLQVPLYLATVGAARDSRRATFTITDRSGAAREVTLAGGPFRRPPKLRAPAGAPSPPLYLQHPDEVFWIHSLSQERAVYFQYNQVANAANETTADAARRLRDTLTATAATTLIVDVRHNNGGNNFLNWPLLRVLFGFEAAAPEHRLFVLTGRITFSAAENFINLINRGSHALFAGEPAGSRPNFTGEDTEVTLPWSGLHLSISSRYWQDSYPGDDRIWIAPDLPVELSSEDYFANRDPVLEAVLQMVSGKR